MNIKITSYDDYGKEVITRNYIDPTGDNLQEFIDDSQTYINESDNKFDTEQKNDYEAHRHDHEET